MKSILLIYRTDTGFTKKYVDWIAEKIQCKTVLLDKIGQLDLASFDVIIYGAGIHAGNIKRLKDFKKKVEALDKKKPVIVFATGGAPCTEAIFSKIKANNFSPCQQSNIKFFYFQSGINYEKMGLLDKTIMKSYNKVLSLKNNKSDVEKGTSKAISSSYDNCNIESIIPMVEYIRNL
ncbi:MAG: flavodoxin domain-containing protein [Dethiosulfatibacter sp.]|nr:flavodoxin domain-containing protein [Dethiosulfatibacter sp.]